MERGSDTNVVAGQATMNPFRHETRGRAGQHAAATSLAPGPTSPEPSYDFGFRLGSRRTLSRSMSGGSEGALGGGVQCSSPCGPKNGFFNVPGGSACLRPGSS